MLRPTRPLLLGSFAAAALCGCGGTELAAVEDPQAHAVAPAAPEPEAPGAAAAPLPSQSEVAEVAPAAPEPAASVEPIGWDFFGPPVSAQEAEEADPVAEHLYLRGFITMEGDPRKAVLWAGDGNGSGRILLLAAGESAGGVTVVELGEDTATVEHPGRVVLTLAPGRAESPVGRSSNAGRPLSVGRSSTTGRRPIAASAPAEPFRLRPSRPTPVRPDLSRPDPTETGVGEMYAPPPPPPPVVDRLHGGDDE